MTQKEEFICKPKTNKQTNKNKNKEHKQKKRKQSKAKQRQNNHICTHDIVEMRNYKAIQQKIISSYH